MVAECEKCPEVLRQVCSEVVVEVKKSLEEGVEEMEGKEKGRKGGVRSLVVKRMNELLLEQGRSVDEVVRVLVEEGFGDEKKVRVRVRSHVSALRRKGLLV